MIFIISKSHSKTLYKVSITFGLIQNFMLENSIFMQFIQISHKLYCLWLWVWKILCALILFPSLIIKNLKGFKYKLKIQLIFFKGFHTIHTVSYCPKRFSQKLIEKKTWINGFDFSFFQNYWSFMKTKIQFDHTIWKYLDGQV